MKNNSIMTLAESISPWLAKDSKQANEIILSTRLNYTIKMTNGSDDVKNDIINCLSSTGNWEEATIFQPAEHPALSAVIEDKFLDSANIRTQKGISAVYKDNLDALCVVNPHNNFTLHYWFSGTENKNIVNSFKKDISKLTKTICNQENDNKSAEKKYKQEIILHLPASHIMGYSSYINSLAEQMDCEITPLFMGEDNTPTGFVKISPKDSAPSNEKVIAAAEILKMVEMDARTILRKRGVNLLYKLLKMQTKAISQESFDATNSNTIRTASSFWLASDMGMLPTNILPKLKQLISITGNKVLDVLLGGYNDSLKNRHRLKQLQKVLK